MPQDFPPGSRLFIGNVDNAVVTKDLLRRIFSQYGEIKEDIQIHRSYAFVQYGDPQSAQAAIAGENHKQLGAKRIEVEIAKGERNPPGSGRRRRRDRDRGGDSSDAKRQRAGDFGPPVPPHMMMMMMGPGEYGDGPMMDPFHHQQFPPHHQHPPPQPPPPPPHHQQPMGRPPATVVPTGMVNVPIYFISSEQSNYANYVSQSLSAAGINNYTQMIDENTFLNLMGQTRYTTGSERFTIFLKRKNEIEQTVSFRAFKLDGTTPGFADTPIQDVIHFINVNREDQPVIPPPPHSHTSQPHFQQQPMPRGNVVSPPQHQQQQPSQLTGGLNLQNLQERLHTFLHPSRISAQTSPGDRPVDPRKSPVQIASPQPAAAAAAARHPTSTASASAANPSPTAAAPLQSTPPGTGSSSPSTTDVLSTLAQIQAIVASGVSSAVNMSALHSTLTTLLNMLQHHQQDQPTHQKSSGDGDSSVNATDAAASSNASPANGVSNEPTRSPPASDTAPPNAGSSTPAKSNGGVAASGDISNILASLQSIIGRAQQGEHHGKQQQQQQ